MLHQSSTCGRIVFGFAAMMRAPAGAALVPDHSCRNRSTANIIRRPSQRQRTGTILRHTARNKKLDDGSVFIRRHKWRPANFSLRRLFILVVFSIFHALISLVNALSDQAQEATGFSAFRS